MSDDFTTANGLDAIVAEYREHMAHGRRVVMSEAIVSTIAAASDLIKSVQAELLAGGSLARLRAIVGITQE